MGGVKHWGKCGCMNSTELKRVGTSNLCKLVHCATVLVREVLYQGYSSNWCTCNGIITVLVKIVRDPKNSQYTLRDLKDFF